MFIYRIRVRGVLSPTWREWFGTSVFSWEDADVTVITIRIEDQAALHGVLRKVRDLGVTLLSVVLLANDERGS